MTDVLDRAQEREEEIRSDALAEHARQVQPPLKKSARKCTACGEPIPKARRLKVPGVQTCVECQKDAEHRDWLTRRRGRGAI